MDSIDCLVIAKLKNSNQSPLTVCALGNISNAMQCDIFTSINDKSSPVKKSLIWDINGQYHPEEVGIISNSIKLLYDSDLSMFEGNISIPSKKSKAEGHSKGCVEH